MRITKEQPTSGQFVAMWEYNGAMWSVTLRIKRGVRERFIEEDDIQWQIDSDKYPENSEMTFYQL